MSANIERLRAVGRAATEGPWSYIASSSSTEEFGHRPGSSATYIAPDEGFSLRVDHTAYGRQAVADAEFCATARNEWDGLLDEVEALRAKVARVEALVEEWGEYGPDSEAWRVFGEQVLSVPFATASLRAALADQSAQDDTEGAQRGAQGIEGGKA